MVKAIKTRARSVQQELDFRRAVQHVPRLQRPGLRALLRRHRQHRARTFYELDPATGHWRRL